MYNKLDISDMESIDVEWNKANRDLSCDLPSDEIPLLDLRQQENNQDPTYLPLSDDKLSALLSKYRDKVRNPKLRRLIVIGIPHGGTTWFATKVLNKHPDIQMHNELLFDWTTSYCNGHTMYNDATRCNWETMRSIMETFYVQKAIDSPFGGKESMFDQYIGFKITLWQIMPTFYGDFVRWIYCNDVTVIHLIRSASINSFYSQQALVFETLFYGRTWYQTQQSTKHAIHNETFDLDANAAKRFVESTEFWQSALQKLVKYHTKSIRQYSVYYEDLIGEFGLKHLNALQGFLNVRYEPQRFDNQQYGIARLHSMPCHIKIKNWRDSVKDELKDTLSYYACEKDNS